MAIVKVHVCGVAHEMNMYYTHLWIWICAQPCTHGVNVYMYAHTHNIGMYRNICKGINTQTCYGQS